MLREPITVHYGGLITVSDYGQLVALVRVDKYLILIDFIYIYINDIYHINKSLVAGFGVADALTTINIFTHSQGCIAVNELNCEWLSRCHNVTLSQGVHRCDNESIKENSEFRDIMERVFRAELR